MRVDDLESFRKQFELEGAADLEISMLEMQIKALRYDPAAGMSMFADQASRQKRIGSGSSMTPANVLSGDAFTGPLSGINASLMSSDNTVTAQLSLAMNRNYNFYADAVRQQNVPITYGGSPKEYVAGITENINVAMRPVRLTLEEKIKRVITRLQGKKEILYPQ